MIFLNHVTPSLVTKSTNQFIKLSRNKLLWRSIHLKNFAKMAENGGFRSQDCVSLLKHLGDLREINIGKSVHSFCVKNGLNRDVYVQNNLIRFYSICGDSWSAHQMFDKMLEPNLVSWTSMISLYVNDGQYDMGVSMFSLMCRSGLQPNEFGFSVVLKACRIMHDFVMGEILHGLILKCGYEFCSFCSASILGMYVESGDLKNAWKFFDGIPLWERSEALWNTLLDAYAQDSDTEEAFKLFRQMILLNNSPNGSTFTILIKLCATLLDFELVKLFHCCIVKIGFEDDIIAGAALVDTYAKLGLLAEAFKVFRNLQEKDNVAWSALLTGFLRNGEGEQGLEFYLKFLHEGNKPDPFTFATVFSLCSNSETGGIGLQAHCSFIKYGFVLDSFAGSALIDMYGSSGMISEAYKCFLEVGSKNEICFGAMINNLIFNTNNEMALELLCEMRKLGLTLSQSTLSYILRACANLHMLRDGRTLHSYIVKNIIDFDSNLCIENALIEMYAKCGAVEKAKLVFEAMTMPNEFSWTTLISGYYESEQFNLALGLFHDMLVSPNIAKPNHFTLVPVLQACIKLEAVDKGKQVHGYVIKAGLEYYPFVGSALINMYASFESEIQNAFLVFLSMNRQDLVAWSAMITAWSQNGYNKEALSLFAEFQDAPGFSIDESILSSSLSACAGLASLEMGKWFHSCIIKTGFESHVHVASSIIDMYSKCGSINDARKFFDGMKDCNLVSWTAMISGYAHYGLGREAVELFDKMEKAGIKPDGVTFIGVLTACSHAGLLQQGWKYFESMGTDYNLEVTINHYACMVDLLGRVEQMGEAEALINKAPFQSKTLLWKTLLGACNKHGSVEVGNWIAQMLIELEPNESATYVLMSNIYAAASMWDDTLELRNKMKEEHISKQPGHSRIQVAN